MHGVMHESASACTSYSQRTQKDLAHIRHTGVIMSGFQSMVLFTVERLPCTLAYLTARHSAKSTNEVTMTIKPKVVL